MGMSSTAIPAPRSCRGERDRSYTWTSQPTSRRTSPVVAPPRGPPTTATFAQPGTFVFPITFWAAAATARLRSRNTRQPSRRGYRLRPALPVLLGIETAVVASIFLVFALLHFGVNPCDLAARAAAAP